MNLVQVDNKKTVWLKIAGIVLLLILLRSCRDDTGAIWFQH